jgi:anti-sigma regulatory factor (Ser/Thr protein kinase)
MPAPRTRITTTDRSRVFRAAPVELSSAREFLREQCREAGVAAGAADDVVIAASEACSNAVLHSGGASFRLSWRHARDRIEVRVRDEGRFGRAASSDTDRHGGNGLALMTALMDEVSVRRGTSLRPGTEVRLVKRLAATAPGRAAVVGLVRR